MTDITLQNMTKVFGSGRSAVRAVDDVSLHIEPGELFFLVGPSGCGKTTLLRMIAGLCDPEGQSGTIRFGDRDVTALAPEHRNTAMVFQNYALWPHMSVADNVEFGPRMQGLTRSRRRELTESSLKRVQMEEFGSRKPNQLSGGQQQRVAVARALAAQSECVLLDEPLSNLDAKLRLHMRGELRRLVKATGATAVYVTHDQKEALSMADRIAVMVDGQIVQVGTPEELYRKPATRFVADFLGEANFADGTVSQIGGADVAVATPYGTLISNPSPVPADGDSVTLIVRPEHITLVAEARYEPQDGVSSLSATVIESTFLGEVRQYTCELIVADSRLNSDAKLVWKVTTVGSSAMAAPGERVRLCIKNSDVVVLI